MKKLKFKFENENLELFADDIQKIVDAFAKRGYEITPSDACRAWENYSDTYCCSWMCMGKYDIDEMVFRTLKKKFEEVE